MGVGIPFFALLIVYITPPANVDVLFEKVVMSLKYILFFPNQHLFKVISSHPTPSRLALPTPDTLRR